MNKILLTSVVFLLFTCEFKTKPDLYFYVENLSKDLKNVKMDIYLDNRLVISDTISFSGLKPSYSTYKLPDIQVGKYIVKVIIPFQNRNLENVYDLEFSGKKYVFIEFNYRRKSKEELEQEEMLFEITNPNKEISLDSIDIKPTIKIHSTEKLPIFE